jgi:hypothetical protein
MLASSRYDKSKNPTKKEYRFLTLEECKKLSSHAEAMDQHGRIARVAITSIKTWKTRIDVLVGWKFGLYEYGKELITCDNDNRFFVASVD